MDAYTNFILKHRKAILILFLVLTVICTDLSTLVGVDYDFADYLPDDAASTKALNVMEEEYDQPIPNLRVMVKDVTIPEALDYKKKLEAVEGVREVTWLNDSIDIYAPLEMADADTIDEWYKDSNALFSVTTSDDDTEKKAAVYGIREVIGEDNAMSGTAVTDILSPIESTAEIQKIMMIALPVVFLILLLTTDSWFEPVLFMLTIGIAIMLNRGTNLMFGTISFVTNAAGAVLQLAVSMDYSIFLLHRFADNRKEGKDVQEAMTLAVHQSVGSVLSSGLTTVTGFAALILMRFKIGPDMGWVMAKAIVFSLICVLCLLPALAISTYKLIDKTQHRSFIPRMDGVARVVTKAGIPVLLLVILLTIPSYLARDKNDFLYGGSRVYSSDSTQMGRDLLAIEAEYGSSNPVVVLVPIGDMQKETDLNQALKDKDYVTSVISYVNTVGSSIPADFVPSGQISKLYSEHFSRFVLTLDAEEGIAGWDEMIRDLRTTCAEYYGDEALLAGNLVSSLDLKDTITADNLRVNVMSIGFVALILLLNFKSITLPILLTLVIEASIWINLSIPYFTSTTLHYIAYLIISSVQLGATIDYAILFTDRYLELRKTMPKHPAALGVVKGCVVSIFTSGIILMIAGVVLGKISSNLVLSQIGTLLGRGALLSFLLVLFVIPCLLVLFDGLIRHTTWHADFHK